MKITFEKIRLSAFSKDQIKSYAQASGDYNPIHLDDQFAKKAGLEGVIAHGMLTMGIIGNYLHSCIKGLGEVISFNTRFKAMTQPGDSITIKTDIEDTCLKDNKNLIFIKITSTKEDGTVTTISKSTIWTY